MHILHPQYELFIQIKKSTCVHFKIQTHNLHGQLRIYILQIHIVANVEQKLLQLIGNVRFLSNQNTIRNSKLNTFQSQTEMRIHTCWVNWLQAWKTVIKQANAWRKAVTGSGTYTIKKKHKNLSVNGLKDMNYTNSITWIARDPHATYQTPNKQNRQNSQTHATPATANCTRRIYLLLS